MVEPGEEFPTVELETEIEEEEEELEAVAEPLFLVEPVGVEEVEVEVEEEVVTPVVEERIIEVP